MKALLADLERKHPTLRETMLAALGNVNPSHLYDRKLQVQATEGAAPAAEDVFQLRLVNARER